MRAQFLPLWGDDYLDRAWCYAELVWGYDNMCVEEDINPVGADVLERIRREYKLLLGKAVVEGNGRARQHLEQLFSTKAVTNRNDLAPVLKQLLDFGVKADVVCRLRVSLAATFLQQQGRLGESLHLFGWLLAIREQQLGPNHPDVAATLNNMAGVLKNQGEYSKAMAIDEQQLGPDHPEVSTTLNNMAGVLDDQG